MIAVIPVDRCAPGRGTFVEVAGHELAVFRFDDPLRVYVLENTCPHAGGNLAGGEVANLIVSCPWHHWEFSLDTGVCTHSAAARVQTYPCEIRDGVVWAELAEI